MIKNSEHDILLTGCLGGLGHTLTQCFNSKGAKVFGIDNFSPQSAPFVHHEFTLNSLKQNDLFDFEAADLRNLNVFKSLLSDYTFKTLIHALPIHYDQYREVLLKSDKVFNHTLELFSLALSSGVESILFPIYGKPFDKANNHLENLTFEPILELEFQIKNRLNLSSNSELYIIPLPPLLGSGQSFLSFPLPQIRQHVAGLPINHNQNLNINLAIRPQDASEIFYNIVNAELLDQKDIYQTVKEKTIKYNPQNILENIARKIEILRNNESDQKVQTTLSESSTNIEIKEFEDENFINEILDYYFSLTYNVPLDWDKKLEKKAKKRNRRKKQND